MGSNVRTKIVLGIDGGGTKTKAWIAAATLRAHKIELILLGQGQAGASNPRSVGFEQCFGELEKAIWNARSQAREVTALDSACISLAGAGRPEDQQVLSAWAQQKNLAARIKVIDDVEPIAFAAEYEHALVHANSESNPWQQWITLIAGTGSIACGKNISGQRARAGGWGFLLGDEGSGFAIGLAALRAVCMAHDGSGPPTSLKDSLFSQLGFQSAKQLVGFTYRTPVPKDEIASLAPTVIKDSHSDFIAAAIVQSAVDALTTLVKAVASGLGLENRSFSLAFSGGILSHHPEMVDAILTKLAREAREPNMFHNVLEPTYGPLMVAARAAVE